MIRRTTPWRKSRRLEKFLFLRNLFRPRHRLMVIDVTREFALHKSVEKNAWRSNPLGGCQGPVNLGVATRRLPQPRLATSRQRLPGPACRLQAPVRRGAAGRAAMSSLSGAHLAPYFAIVLLSSAADVAHIRPQFSSTRKKKDFLQGNKL